ncbi:MAG: protein-tyrosine phosphatase family protein [Deefgea sp.]
MSLHPFDALDLPDGGQILFTPCPGTKTADLETSVAQLKSAGASAIVTLMPTDELQANGAASLPDVCQQHDLAWYHFPVEDDAAPAAEFASAWAANSADVLQILADGGTIAVHCKGGSGRTGLMVAMLLINRGEPLPKVIEQVQEIRPKSLQIPAHLAFLSDVAAQV